MLDNASPLEMAYTAASVVGLLFATRLLWLSVGDEIRRRRRRINGIVRLDVQKSIVTAFALVIALGCLSMIGVNAMATPPNPNIVADATTASTTVINALLFVSADIALIALTAYRILQRQAVNHELDHEEQEAARRDRRENDQPTKPWPPPVPPEGEES